MKPAPGPDLTGAVKLSWAGVARLWPKWLTDFLARISSPARPEEVMAEAGRQDWLQDLARTWPELSGEARGQALDDLLGRLTRLAYQTRPYCLRCGECCRAGSPALREEEAGLLRPGGPFHLKAYALRAGEPALDQAAGEIRILDRELIKLRETAHGCVFHVPSQGCAVYPDRPAQCREQSCYSPEAAAAAQAAGTYLTRHALFARDRLRLDYALALQARCPTQDLVDLAQRAERDPAALETLTERVKFDLHVRDFSLNRGDLAAEELDLVLGRPLAVALRPLGLFWAPDRNRLVRRQGP